VEIDARDKRTPGLGSGFGCRPQQPGKNSLIYSGLCQAVTTGRLSSGTWPAEI